MPRSERLLMEGAYLKHVKKPDVDNLVKLYLDVLSGQLFEDDNCVSLGQCIKIYSPKPKVIIQIKETENIITYNQIAVDSVE